MAKQTKTDNSFFFEKVDLRLETVNKIHKESINVLEAYAGDGYIWHEVKSRTNKVINILRIDQKTDKEGIYLIGDNRKYLSEIDLSKFDIIDLDAYGIPFDQLEMVFNKKFKGYVHVTAIQSFMGQLPFGLLKAIGIPESFYNKSAIFFSRHGPDKIMKYLQLNGVKNITGYFIEKKNYFYFNLDN